MTHRILGRWLPGWTVSGALGALVMFKADEIVTASSVGWPAFGRRVTATAMVLIGGPLALSAGAYLSAKWQKRGIVREICNAGGASFVGAALFLFLVGFLPVNQTTGDGLTRLDALTLDITVSSGLFGLLYGVGMSRHDSTTTFRSKAGIPLGTAGAAILGSVSILVASYVLGGGPFFKQFLPGRLAVPVGVAAGGFIGSLVPGIAVEHLLNTLKLGSSREGNSTS